MYGTFHTAIAGLYGFGEKLSELYSRAPELADFVLTWMYNNPNPATAVFIFIISSIIAIAVIS